MEGCSLFLLWCGRGTFLTCSEFLLVTGALLTKHYFHRTSFLPWDAIIHTPDHALDLRGQQDPDGCSEALPAGTERVQFRHLDFED